MNLLRPSKSTSYTIIPYHHLHSPLFHSKNTVRYDNHNKLLKLTYNNVVYAKKLLCVRAYNADREVEGDDDGEDNAAGNGERKGFLSLEEAGLVEISGLSTHERFLCRLTISSLNLLRVIAEQEKCTIEELNAGRICDWFLKDKLKREQNIGSAVLQWDDDDPFAQF